MYRVTSPGSDTSGCWGGVRWGMGGGRLKQNSLLFSFGKHANSFVLPAPPLPAPTQQTLLLHFQISALLHYIPPKHQSQTFSDSEKAVPTWDKTRDLGGQGSAAWLMRASARAPVNRVPVESETRQACTEITEVTHFSFVSLCPPIHHQDGVDFQEKNLSKIKSMRENCGTCKRFDTLAFLNINPGQNL